MGVFSWFAGASLLATTHIIAFAWPLHYASHRRGRRNSNFIMDWFSATMACSLGMTVASPFRAMHSTATKGQFGISLHTPQQWLSYEQNTFREDFTVVKRMFAEQGPRYVLQGDRWRGWRKWGSLLGLPSHCIGC